MALPSTAPTAVPTGAPRRRANRSAGLGRTEEVGGTAAACRPGCKSIASDSGTDICLGVHATAHDTHGNTMLVGDIQSLQATAGCGHSIPECL